MEGIPLTTISEREPSSRHYLASLSTGEEEKVSMKQSTKMHKYRGLGKTKAWEHNQREGGFSPNSIEGKVWKTKEFNWPKYNELLKLWKWTGQYREGTVGEIPEASAYGQVPTWRVRGTGRRLPMLRHWYRTGTREPVLARMVELGFLPSQLPKLDLARQGSPLCGLRCGRLTQPEGRWADWDPDGHL